MPLYVVLAVMNMESHGGVADQITSLAVELPSYGIQPIVLVRNPLSAEHSYVPTLEEQGVRVWAIRYPVRRLVRAIFTLLWFLTIPFALTEAILRHKSMAASMDTMWALLRRLGYAGLDLVFLFRLVEARLIRRAKLVHFRNPDCWQKLPWAHFLGLRTVYTEDAIPQSITKHYYQHLSMVRRSIDAATAVSQASANSLQLFLGRDLKVHVIPNMFRVAISVPQPVPEENREFVLGCLARLVPEKDLGTLLHAFRIALSQNSALRLRIYGDGPERRSLKELATQLLIEDRTVFGGVFAKSHLPAIMRTIDLMVQSSVSEGFGVALIEGMAFGKPAVATAVGGVPEVIEDGVTGVLVPPSDPGALASAILVISSDVELYQRMSRAARQRYLTCFTPEQVIPRYVALYERLTK